jgi:uncharacterized protein YegJ (DUF2314 family)
MTKKGLLFIFAIQILAFGACNDHAKTEKKIKDNMYTTNGDDLEMNRAMDIAHARFSAFDSAFDSGTFDIDKFSIKVKYPHDKGTEYIWLVNISKADGQYMGIVSDTPRETKVVKYGDRPTINRDDVVDWLYGKDSLLHGGYTMRLIYGRMSKEQLKKEMANFPYKIED